MADGWIFADAPNTAVITLRSIIVDAAPILRVSHDVDDGAWQFLGWETPNIADAIVVCLSSVLEQDPTVKQVMDLPLGWRAWRRRINEPWIREADAVIPAQDV